MDGLIQSVFLLIAPKFAMQVKLESLIFDIAHDCELNFVDVSKAAEKVKAKPEKVFYKGNPFLKGIFLSETSYIACGFDKVPYHFKKEGKGWVLSKILDEGIKQVK